MQSEKVIIVAGGDLRMCCAAERLAKQTGWQVQAAGFSKAPAVTETVIVCSDHLENAVPCDVLVLPIGAGKKADEVETPFGTAPLPLTKLLALTKPGGLVMGGQLKPEWIQKCRDAGMETADYLKREELCIANAVPTAEGAIQIAMEETMHTLYGSKAVITGCGRIGMALGLRLKALGMETVICARRCASRAMAEAAGCRSVPMEQLTKEVADCHVVFNTIPAPVLTETVLKALPAEAVVIDLASRPGGTDFDAAKKLGTRVVWALSLPPKMWG